MHHSHLSCTLWYSSCSWVRFCVCNSQLIEGLAGEKAIYKRRGEKEPEVCYFSIALLGNLISSTIGWGRSRVSQMYSSGGGCQWQHVSVQ